jgi:hypothetical protein
MLVCAQTGRTAILPNLRKTDDATPSQKVTVISHEYELTCINLSILEGL